MPIKLLLRGLRSLTSVGSEGVVGKLGGGVAGVGGAHALLQVHHGVVHHAVRGAHAVHLTPGPRSAISLPPVLEPVGDLGEGQAGLLGQLPLFIRGRVPVVLVHVLERVPALLLEAVDSLLPVPDSAGQGELPPQPVLVHGSKRPGPDLLRLLVMGSVPHLLQLVVVPGVEVSRLHDRVQLLPQRATHQEAVRKTNLEVSFVEGHRRLAPEDRVSVLMAVIRQKVTWGGLGLAWFGLVQLCLKFRQDFSFFLLFLLLSILIFPHVLQGKSQPC